jgi:hypothetical protein
MVSFSRGEPKYLFVITLRQPMGLDILLYIHKKQKLCNRSTGVTKDSKEYGQGIKLFIIILFKKVSLIEEKVSKWL